jgi:hypothetical protein
VKQKILVWGVVLFVAWQILLSDTVSNALLSFFFGGIVPGTNVVLSPDAMLGVVGGLFAVGFVAMLVMSYRSRTKLLLNESDIDTEAALPKRPKKHQPVVSAVSVPKTPHAVRRFPAMLKAKTAPLFARLRPWSYRVWVHVRKGAGKLAVYAIGFYELGRLATIKYSKRAWEEAKLAWHRAEPRIWRLNSQLERQWLRFRAWAAVRWGRNEFFLVLRAASREVVEVFRQAILAGASFAREQARKFKNKA